MSNSSSATTSSTSVAYEFKYFPRYGRWTKEMQAELDEHSRRMAKLMMHVQDLHKPRKIEDEQKEDTDADCVGSPLPYSGSTSPSMSPPPTESPVYCPSHNAPFCPAPPAYQPQEDSDADCMWSPMLFSGSYQVNSPSTSSGFSSGFNSPSTSPQFIGGTVYYPTHYAPSCPVPPAFQPDLTTFSSGSNSPSKSPQFIGGTVYYY